MFRVKMGVSVSNGTTRRGIPTSTIKWTANTSQLIFLPVLQNTGKKQWTRTDEKVRVTRTQ